ncbi:antirestriction protein [Peristeroidobacter soli]|uniref:antirestriction protein n=1 Tax=Peristeroidobacter soli TaxID=2497877 RepID=UPI001FE947C2|nr:antirestriction protein [Peristeroidobacter soli]
MNTSTDLMSQSIQARRVAEAERLEMLPRHFGRHMLTVEDAVYTFMRRLAPQYAGGYWNFIELSNGGVYLAPHGETIFRIDVEGNGFSGEMSADAAGITACLFALSHLSFQIADECIADHFHYLREFALSHAEAGTILAAID